MASLTGLSEVCKATDTAAMSWAWAQLCRYTFNRVEADDIHDEELVSCFDELAGFKIKLDQNGGRLPSSESVDNWSRSFSTEGGSNDIHSAAKDIIHQWLGHTDLLYRGYD